MCTFNYAIWERREDKIRLFADLFSNYCQNRCFDADADIYEEHMNILQDLSYREFQILSILARFEHEYAESAPTIGVNSSTHYRTNSLWSGKRFQLCYKG